MLRLGELEPSAQLACLPLQLAISKRRLLRLDLVAQRLRMVGRRGGRPDLELDRLSEAIHKRACTRTSWRLRRARAGRIASAAAWEEQRRITCHNTLRCPRQWREGDWEGVADAIGHQRE